MVSCCWTRIVQAIGQQEFNSALRASPTLLQGGQASHHMGQLCHTYLVLKVGILPVCKLMASCFLPKQFILNQEWEEQILDTAHVRSNALPGTVVHNRIGRYIQRQ